ncbi:MAG TPA: serine/threonine-protein kinase, partial [Dokdonella sp.]
MNAADAAARWPRLRRLFAAALDLPRERRDAWLEARCADTPELLGAVRRLLAAHDEPEQLLDRGAAGLVAGLLADEAMAPETRIGTRFGAYRLLRLLGRGGMGRVYLAERTDGEFERVVALKLIDDDAATPDARERFLREREILARLSHPNVAMLHDGGVGADGTPFFTMEYVEGEPLTHWCDERRLGVAARVRLVLKVCDAVQYAHRNLVVHRDIKPAKVLVTGAGEPKLLDFGIAKLLDDAARPGLTGTRSQPMTREYAAPEQVLAQPVTTATDVYALGVLLYELLSGRLPYALAERGEVSWQKAIVEEAPAPLDRALARRPPDEARDAALASTPSRLVAADDARTLARRRGLSAHALRRALGGDLDRIVRRALEKRPESRYASVDALADDLRAWLERRPLRGSNRRYRVGRFVRRHWLPLGAGAAIAAALAVGAAGIVWQARRVAREARTTAEVKDFLIALFDSVDPRESKGRDVR